MMQRFDQDLCIPASKALSGQEWNQSMVGSVKIAG